METNKKKQNMEPEQQGQQHQAQIPIEEQMARRQSAPRPTPQSEVQKLQMAQPQQAPIGAMDGFKALAQVIGREQIQAAQLTLQKYKEGKANLERRIVENEQWYKLRHWECMRKAETNQVEPSSGWLFNAIANKHADAMDNFPSPNVLPREEGDKAEAEMLSSILPVILEQNDFEETYDNVMDYKLKAGTGIYGVFWDKEKMNGLGDITVRKVDIINLFWESGITDIQRSRNLFHVDLADNDLLLGAYPQLEGKLGNSTMDISKYIYDDSVDTNNKSAVVDWYYKKRQGNKIVLHYCKYVNDVVLFATENEPEFADSGWYDHGLYPFVFDPLFSVEGTPCGFGYIDVGKSAQEYIDRGNQAIMQNMLANAKPRHFIRNDGEVNEEEYADLSKDFIHVNGNLGQDSIMPVQGKPLNDIYVAVLNNKVEELKEVTGNRDVATGGTTGGVTSASGIASMQEASSKLSRQDNKASYRAFRKVCLMIIELIRQFYDVPRCFRIMGANGMQRFVEYSNANIQPQFQGIEMGVDMGYRVPLFDLEISASKQSPYSRMAQNDLAIQFYTAGFFAPQNSDQALACLNMMDFDRKEFVMQEISKNGTMYQQMMMMQQQMLQMAQVIDKLQGSNIAEQMSAGITGGVAPAASSGGELDADKEEALGGANNDEHPIARKARQRVAESTDPT